MAENHLGQTNPQINRRKNEREIVVGWMDEWINGEKARREREGERTKKR